jgi:NADPH:quinone reductase-like Zn-dependent oxidoreductase
VDRAAVGDRDVLVRVRATTVNRTDCGLRAAKPWSYRLFLGLRRPRRTVLGTEFAGEVEAVGDGVTAFKVGDRVFGFSGTALGPRRGPGRARGRVDAGGHPRPASATDRLP